MNQQFKVAKDESEAWDIEEKFEDMPHGWIQWKGTDVCMDVHCKCGCLSHIDATFAYFVKCAECGTVYSVNGHVEFVEVLNPPSNVVIAER